MSTPSPTDEANTVQFDADAVAKDLGYKSGTVLKNRWSQIKRKKINVSGGGGGGVAAAASPSGIKKRTPKKSAKAALAEADGGDGDDDNEVPDTPVKTPAKRGRKPTAKKLESVGQEGESEEEGKVKPEAEEEF